MEKSTELMNEDLYWSIINESLQNSNHQDKQKAYLMKKISQLTEKEIIGFKLRTNKLLDETYTSEMWCAAYLINGGCSDDGFEYFRTWLISRGKSIYYLAKEDPDNLVNVVSEDEEYEFEEFLGITDETFEIRYQQNINDFIDYKQLAENEIGDLEIEFNWEEENPDSMKKICPKLFDKFW